MNTSKKTNNCGGERVRQMTAEERAQIDLDMDACVAEVLGLDAGGQAPPAVGFFGKVAATGRRVKAAVTAGARRVRGVATRENAMAAIEASAAFGKIAARYTVDAAKAAAMRRVQRAIDDKVGGLVSGGVGGSDAARGTR